MSWARSSRRSAVLQGGAAEPKGRAAVDEAVSEMELRVAALEMLVMELMAQLPTEARRRLGRATPEDSARDGDDAFVRDRILAIRNQILANAYTTEPQGLIASLRLRPDND